MASTMSVTETVAVKGVRVGVWVAVVCALVAWTCHLVTRHPFYDECIHIRHLWRLSVGDRAYRDFWCAYPIPVYVLTLPFFRLLPESAISILALRALMLLPVAGLAGVFAWHARRVCGSSVWGIVPFVMVASVPDVARFLVEYSTDHSAALAACAAMVLMLGEANPKTVCGAAILSVLSVFFAPKYVWYLVPGGLAMLAAAWRDRPTGVRALAWGLGGAVAGFVAILALHAVVHVSFWDALYWVYVVQGRYNVTRDIRRLGFIVLHFLFTQSWLGILLTAGVAGLIKAMRVSAWRYWCTAAGIYAAVLFSLVWLRQEGAQYKLPVLLTFVLVIPYAMNFVNSERGRMWLTAVLTVLGCAVCGFNMARATRDFSHTPFNAREDFVPGFVVEMTMPGVHRLYAMEKLLDMIPRDERVVAVWYMHPLFRRDVTFITQDDRPSLVPLIPAKHPVRRHFEPATLYTALTAAPPAYISPFWLNQNYPPGWMEVCRDFVNSTNLYQQITIAGERALVRKDLLARAGLTRRSD